MITSWANINAEALADQLVDLGFPMTPPYDTLKEFSLKNTAGSLGLRH